jgi:hypothetical protein
MASVTAVDNAMLAEGFSLLLAAKRDTSRLQASTEGFVFGYSAGVGGLFVRESGKASK